MTRMLPLWLLVVVFVGLQCAKGEPPSAAPAPPLPPEVAAAPSPAADAAPADVKGKAPRPAIDPDPGPQLSQQAGKAELRKLPDVAAQVTARTVKDGHTYLRAVLPGSYPPPEVGGAGGERQVRFIVRGARHGVAVIENPDGTPPHTILVRLVGAEPVADFELSFYDTGSRWSVRETPGWVRGTVRLTEVATAKPEPELAGKFFGALALFFERTGQIQWNRPRPFYSYAQGRARLLAEGGKPERLGPEPGGPPRRGDIGDMMSLYTGMLSVEEALQADRGLLLRGAPTAEATVPLTAVEGVPLAAHPWADMLAKLGKTPAIEPLASRVPADALYVHFGDLRTAVKVLRDLDEWLTPLAQILDNRPGTNHLVQRYEEELMVERLGLAEKLGHLAAQGVAFVAGDPFFREGTDLSILFRVRDRNMLLAALNLYEDRAKGRHADLAESTYTVGSHTVRLMATPDGTVRQHRLELDDVLILSNSRAAIERLVAVADGQRPALAAAGDFQYLRAVYPYGPDEAGFAFVSDAFVAHAVSPRTKIGAARRMAAAADLAAVSDAALLFGWLEGRRPTGLDELQKSGFLFAAERTHADGSPIAFDPQRGASSARYGRAAALTPLAELPLDKVTAAEESAYKAFRESYQNYWRRYLDPIAARITRSSDGQTLEVDARMLPLISGSDYDELINAVGNARVAPPTLRGALQWTLAVGRDAKLRGEIDRTFANFGQRDLSLGWLGDFVTIGALDRSGIWDLALLTDEIPENRGPRDHDQAREFAVFGRAPVFVGAQVANPLGLAAALTALRTAVTTAAPGLVEWGEGGKHRDIPIVVVRGRSTRDAPADKLALFYTTVDNVLLASLDRPTLQVLMDAVLDGKAPRPVAAGDAAKAGAPEAATGGVQAELRLTLDEKESWLGRAILGLLEGQARSAAKTAFRDVEALTRGLPGLDPAGEAFPAAALAYLGYEPQAVQGGSFALAKEGFPTLSRYGSEAEPVFPAVPIAEAPLTALVKALDTLALGLAFEGSGDTRGLHATFRWVRK